jgi:hypothetical protein
MASNALSLLIIGAEHPPKTTTIASTNRIDLLLLPVNFILRPAKPKPETK